MADYPQLHVNAQPEAADKELIMIEWHWAVSTSCQMLLATENKSEIGKMPRKKLLHTSQKSNGQHNKDDLGWGKVQGWGIRCSNYHGGDHDIIMLNQG